MKRIPQGKYTQEFRAEAVKLVNERGLSVAQAAKDLSLPKSSLNNWVSAEREGKLQEVGKGQRELGLRRNGRENRAMKISSTW